MNDNQKINIIFVLADIIEQYTLELSVKNIQLFKQDSKDIAKRCKRLVKFLDSKAPNFSESFGEISDELRNIIEKHILNKK